MQFNIIMTKMLEKGLIERMSLLSVHGLNKWALLWHELSSSLSQPTRPLFYDVCSLTKLIQTSHILLFHKVSIVSIRSSPEIRWKCYKNTAKDRTKKENIEIYENRMLSAIKYERILMLFIYNTPI